MAARTRGAGRRDVIHVSGGFDAELAFLLVVACLLTALFVLRG